MTNDNSCNFFSDFLFLDCGNLQTRVQCCAVTDAETGKVKCKGKYLLEEFLRFEVERVQVSIRPFVKLLPLLRERRWRRRKWGSRGVINGGALPTSTLSSLLCSALCVLLNNHKTRYSTPFNCRHQQAEFPRYTQKKSHSLRTRLIIWAKFSHSDKNLRYYRRYNSHYLIVKTCEWVMK